MLRMRRIRQMARAQFGKCRISFLFLRILRMIDPVAQDTPRPNPRRQAVS